MSRGYVRARGLGLAAVVLALACARAPASEVVPPEARLPPVEVKDLDYGDVLFHFYQDDHFGALTRLTVARERARLPHHLDDAELLEGGLYLSLGQHREAGEIFSRILDRPRVPAPVRDRARFYLGKVWYQRGYMDKAVTALDHAGFNTLPPNMEAERRLLLAEARLALGQYDQAVAVLRGWKGSPTWTAYAQFNLGIALVRSAHVDEGVRALDSVARGTLPGAEGAGLRDKASLAMGFALLQSERSQEAAAALERVRLEGPFSNKALLGLGWAQSAAGHYEEALTPWLELRGRNLLDPAVQESYLAVPHAYAKLGANAQAAEYYENAVSEFERESLRIDESIAAIRGGKLLDTILSHDVKGDMGWAWQLAHLPDAPESRYLYHILAQNPFQEGLKNYRQLVFLRRNLELWTENLDAYDNMISTRRHRYEIEIPAARARLERTDLESLRARHSAIDSRLAAAEATGDVVALGTTEELDAYHRVDQLQQVAASSTDEDAQDARDKLRLMQGVLYWQMDAAFKARAWSVRRNSRETLQALREAEGRWSLVAEARDAVPTRDDAYAARVAELGPRVRRSEAEIDRLETAEAAYLSGLAVEELQAQKSRLAAYLLQARYALATLYDRTADDRATRERPAKPVPSGPELEP